MSQVLVTGSAGLVGSEAVRFFSEQGREVVGIDNNMRKQFFGPEGDTAWNNERLKKQYPCYRHLNMDIRDEASVARLFQENHFDLIIHAAAQPSHDWAAFDPQTDFSINAQGTLILLENCRNHAGDAVFIYTSTNKVYGDLPNRLPFVEKETRYELAEPHPWHQGIDETMSVDQSMHSLFGVSKLSADLLVQEYGRYFQLRTAVFRGGCLTGAAHSGTRLHGFLSYIMRCCITGERYVVNGYQGKQVRDNIDARDLVRAFFLFSRNPRCGEVYNIGGGRFCNCSVLEAIDLCRKISGKELRYEYAEQARAGDHIWWISSNARFQSHYPEWRLTYGLDEILREIYETQKSVVQP
jgi:CDP-paratose 2-epimerase